MSDIKFIEGGISIDYRGQISHVNDLNMEKLNDFTLFISMIPRLYEHGMRTNTKKNGFML